LQMMFAGTESINDGMPKSEYWEAITAPTILASVYGGGQDGHVRRDTHVIVNSGTIGLPYNSDNQGLMGTDNLDDPLWLFRGNVFGGGSGVNKYKFDFNGDGDMDDNDGTLTYYGNSVKEEDYSTSAGSVTRFTTVDIKGGTIHRNVYGGGSLGSVGAPKIPPITVDPLNRNDDDASTKGQQSQSSVTIGGAGKVYIGTADEYQQHYGGEVYGACRGLSSDNTSIATSVWTKVLIKAGANILGNVFGGGDAGMVRRDTDVQVGE